MVFVLSFVLVVYEPCVGVDGFGVCAAVFAAEVADFFLSPVIPDTVVYGLVHAMLVSVKNSIQYRIRILISIHYRLLQCTAHPIFQGVLPHIITHNKILKPASY